MMNNSFPCLKLFADKVLEYLEKRIQDCNNKQFSDEDLLTLHSVYGSVFQRALDVLEKYPLIETYSTAEKVRVLIEIKGENDRYYRIFPRLNYCPCRAFRHQVIEKKCQITCKHVLVGRIASILASMDSGKTLYSLLKAIQFQEYAVFCAMSDGLKLTVEEGKCVQASAYIPADNFTEFHVRDDVDVRFKISIAVLTECLNIFGASEESSLKMYYSSEGSPLLLVLQPQSVHNVMTDCEICTQSAAGAGWLQLRDEDAPEAAKLVLRAGAFLGLLADLERSCDVIELNFSPEHPNLSIVTYGMQDRSCIEVPKSSDMMQSFSCSQAVSLKYQLPHVRLIMKALAISSKVVLRCSSNGLLLLQLKLEKDDQRQMFSEFYIVSLLDDY